MKYILTTICIMVFISLTMFVIKEGVERNEKVECAKLHRDSLIYQGFFYADWQKEMCNIK